MRPKSTGSSILPFQKNKDKQNSPLPPVGLSDPQHVARRKAMFDFLSDMHALG